MSDNTKNTRQVLHTVKHDGVHLLVWIEDNELLWAHRVEGAVSREWRDWSNSYLSTETNRELTRLWDAVNG